jgi:hypothetical protein
VQRGGGRMKEGNGTSKRRETFRDGAQYMLWFRC